MKKIIHIDESGDPLLKNECYVICSVISSEEDLESELETVDKVRKLCRGGGELKSSKTGNSLDKRLDICQHLCALKSKCIVLIVRKDRLDNSGGFRFKTSVYKFFQKRLFEKIYKGMYQVSIVIDTYGTQKFMDGFETYINKEFNPSLFQYQEKDKDKQIKRSSPKIDCLLQVADYVGGTIRRYVQGDDDARAYMALRPILGVVDVRPRAIEDPHIDTDVSLKDKDIYHHCLHAAEAHLKLEDDEILRESLQYLLYHLTYTDNQFIDGGEILDYLKDEGLIDQSVDKTWLQAKVIAKLRKSGVPIAASRDGYKIPASEQDVSIFVDFVASKTIPYLQKVNQMRNSLSIGLAMKYDMLDHAPELKQLMAPLNMPKLDVMEKESPPEEA